ncbi:MAG: VacJ family lipoprotein [Bdellovibrionota bacterium]
MKRLFYVFLMCGVLVNGVVFAEDEISDPFESFNRAVFEFNDTLDVYVAEPIARGYGDVMPEFVKKGVNNFFKNLSYPKYLLSDLIQLKFTQALKHTGRFIVNSTVGVAGFIEVASEIGLEHHYEDIGVAFAYQGIPAGPYIMLPFLGPTTVRDGIGKCVEFFISPWYWIDDWSDLSWEWDWTISSSATALDLIDTRYGLLEAMKAAKESSVDYYLFTQSAYYQYRNGLVKDKYESKQDSAEIEDDWLLEEDEEEIEE